MRRSQVPRVPQLANALHNSNKLKLGLFSLNADGGIAITKVPERWRADWAEIAEVAQMVDRAGFEFILPIARWKGFGGELDVRTLCFETFTFAAALSAMTEQITIFSTVHVPVVHPVFAAKALVTVDHVSGGRAGLNIVAGWNQGEFDMFGHALAEHDRRYEQGLEWFEVMNRIFTSKERFDHDGEFYKLTGVIGKPQPMQRPRPLTMSAASSPAGRAFAMKTSDLLVTVLGVAGEGLPPVRALAEQRKAEGRPLQVITTTHVVCRETDREAEDYYQHYAVDACRYRGGRLSHEHVAQESPARHQRDLQRAQALCRRPELASADRPAGKDRRRIAVAQRRRHRRRHAVVRQLQGRTAVLHRTGAAAAAAGRLAAIGLRTSPAASRPSRRREVKPMSSAVAPLSAGNHGRRGRVPIVRIGADLVDRRRIDPAQVARDVEGGVLARAVDHVEPQQLLLGLGKRPVEHHAGARAAQGAGLGGTAQPRRRAEQFVRVEPVMDGEQVGHQRRVLLRRPGHDLGFDVIGQNGVEHRFSSFAWGGSGCRSRTFGHGLSRQTGF